MEHDRRRALFRMELVLVAELHPDLAGIEEAEKLVLVLQVRAGGIAEGVAAAAVALLEHLLHVAIVLGGEAELGAAPLVHVFGHGLGHLRRHAVKIKRILKTSAAET